MTLHLRPALIDRECVLGIGTMAFETPPPATRTPREIFIEDLRRHLREDLDGLPALRRTARAIARSRLNDRKRKNAERAHTLHRARWRTVRRRRLSMMIVQGRNLVAALEKRGLSEKVLPRRTISIAEIITQEAARSGTVEVGDILGRSRSPNIVAVRQKCAFRALAETPFSTPQIARAMGGRDHTTILHQAEVYCTKHNVPFPRERVVRNARAGNPS